MGSPISPLIANLFMEECGVKALSTAPHPHLWLRYVDDIYVIQKAEHSQLPSTAYQHTGPSHTVYNGGTQPRWITSIPRHPQFHQGPTTPSSPQFTGNQHIQTNIYTGTLITSSGTKYSVYNTLAYRDKVAPHYQQSLHKELDHIR